MLFDKFLFDGVLTRDTPVVLNLTTILDACGIFKGFNADDYELDVYTLFGAKVQTPFLLC